MQQYTIYCTPEQTKKALKLGAPLQLLGYRDCTGWDDEPAPKNSICVNLRYYKIPTAEQMFGWLDEKGMSIRVSKKSIYWTYDVLKKDNYSAGGAGFASRKEATIAAIDAVLDYL